MGGDQNHIYASTHSRLKNKQELKRFKEISLKLVCQCGCKMLLDSCNHITCMAWSMRSVIDSLIRNGYSNEFILDSFENGFDSLVDNKKIMPIFAKETYKSYMPYYRKGFGETVYSEPRDNRLTIWVLVSIFFVFLYPVMFIYRKKKKIPMPKETVPLSSEEQELLEKIYRG